MPSVAQESPFGDHEARRATRGAGGLVRITLKKPFSDGMGGSSSCGRKTAVPTTSSSHSRARSLSTSDIHATAVYGRSASDFWVGTRVATLDHFARTRDRHRLLDAGAQGIWQGGSSLYLAIPAGVRVVPLPVSADWNGAAEIYGDFSAIAEEANDAAFAVGAGGLIARYDGEATKSPNRRDPSKCASRTFQPLRA